MGTPTPWTRGGMMALVLALAVLPTALAAQEDAPAQDAAALAPVPPETAASPSPDEHAPAQTPDETSLKNWQIYVDFRLWYDGRILSDGAPDRHDLVQGIDLDARYLTWDHLRLVARADIRENLTGDDASALGRSAILANASGDAAFALVYDFNVQIDDLSVLRNLTIGRLYVRHELYDHLDGVSLTLQAWQKRFTAFVYGGLPVRFYSDQEMGDAQSVGGGVELTPWELTRITLEYRYLHEEGVLSDGASADPSEDPAHNHQAALSIKQAIFDYGYFNLAFSLFNDDPYYLKARLALLFEKTGTEIYGSYYYQFLTIRDMPTSLSPFAHLMGPLEPYHAASITVSQRLYQEYLWLAVGGQIRYLGNNATDADFNHSFHHEYLALTLDGLPLPCLSFTVQADVWQALGQDDDLFVTAGGEAVYQRPQVARAALGVSYSLYKYDYYRQADEKSHVYTVYADAAYYPLSWLYVKARYELNIYDLYEHGVTAMLGVRY